MILEYAERSYSRNYVKMSRIDFSDLQPFGVVTVCKSGRHRSVAMAVIVRHIFKAAGWEAEVDYASEGQVWSKSTCSGGCPLCKWEDRKMVKELDRALFHCQGMFYHRWQAVCEKQERPEFTGLFGNLDPELIVSRGNYIH